MAIPTVIGKVFKKGARKLSQWGERTPSEILKDEQIKDVTRRERRQRYKDEIQKGHKGRIPVRRPKKITPEELLGRTLTPAEQKRWDRLSSTEQQRIAISTIAARASKLKAGEEVARRTKKRYVVAQGIKESKEPTKPPKQTEVGEIPAWVKKTNKAWQARQAALARMTPEQREKKRNRAIGEADKRQAIKESKSLKSIEERKERAFWKKIREKSFNPEERKRWKSLTPEQRTRLSKLARMTPEQRKEQRRIEREFKLAQMTPKQRKEAERTRNRRIAKKWGPLYKSQRKEINPLEEDVATTPAEQKRWDRLSSKKRLQEEIAPYFESDTPITDVTKTGHPKSKVLFPLGRLSTAQRRRFLQTEQGRAAAKTKENLSRIEDTGEYAPPREQIAREIGLGRGTQDITDADVADLLEYIGKTEYLKRSEGGQIKPRGVGKALRGWGNKEKRQKGGQIMTKRNKMSHVGLFPAEEARAGTQSEAKRTEEFKKKRPTGGYIRQIKPNMSYADFKKMRPDVDITEKGFIDMRDNLGKKKQRLKKYKKGGDVKVAGRGSRKGKPSKPKPQKPPKMFAQHGGMVQGYDARKDEQLGMTRGPERNKDMSMAARRNVARATRKPRGTYGFKKGGPVNKKPKGVGSANRGFGATGKH